MSPTKLTLVNLAEVHHLVDEPEDTLGITTDSLVDTATMGVVVLFDKRQQRRDDERHRCTYLVGDIHKELELGVGHFLGMDVFLQTQTVLFFTLVLATIAC